MSILRGHVSNLKNPFILAAPSRRQVGSEMELRAAGDRRIFPNTDRCNRDNSMKFVLRNFILGLNNSRSSKPTHIRNGGRA